MTYDNFKAILAEQTDMALATSVDDLPNVRIVNFYYDEGNGRFYFTSFSDSNKIKELCKNHQVALVTLPKSDGKYVGLQGTVSESDKNILDLRTEYVAKHPNYEWIIDSFHNQLTVFEIVFSEATVAMSNTDIQVISVSKRDLT